MPVILGGTDVLFRGRRVVVQILPPRDALTLAGLGAGSLPPPVWSAADRLAARAIAEQLHATTADAVAAAHEAAQPPPGAARPWLWLTHRWR